MKQKCPLCDAELEVYEDGEAECFECGWASYLEEEPEAPPVLGIHVSDGLATGDRVR